MYNDLQKMVRAEDTVFVMVYLLADNVLILMERQLAAVLVCYWNRESIRVFSGINKNDHNYF